MHTETHYSASKECINTIFASNPKIINHGLHRPIAHSLKIKKNLTSLACVSEYTKYRKRLGNASSKSIKHDESIILRFLSLSNFIDLNDFDVENCTQIFEALYFYPKNANKIKEFNGLSGFEVIEKNLTLKNPYEFLSFATILKSKQIISQFFKWCVDFEHINFNPISSVVLKKEKPNKKRFKFTDEDLNKIFCMEDYTNNNFLHNYYYWLPLLLRFTGCRLNELCQLYRCDIEVIDGIWCICISDKLTNQRIKTASSERKIPIHSKLLELGFLDFVQSGTSKRLFPELKLVKGYYSNNASKWFLRRREKLGLIKGKDAHSFRHTFINELKQQKVNKEYIEALAGHAHKSESLEIYSEKYSPKILQEFIEMIDASHTCHIRPFN
ncbi:site-specific integrase [Vibrio fluvialis]